MYKALHVEEEVHCFGSNQIYLGYGAIDFSI